MMHTQHTNPYLPDEATIIERIEEGPDLFTLRLQLNDQARQEKYTFSPGQFNMLYLYGVGEVPISIVSDPKSSHLIDHTIRVVGRVTKGLANLQAGERIGLRGPYGRGWPVTESQNRDIVVITGGLGCAPVVSVINYIEQRREQFGQLNIVQGVKHRNDFIWQERYEQWRKLTNTQVLLTADTADALWPWKIGPVTSVFNELIFDPHNVSVMMCGPQGMMLAASQHMLDMQVAASEIFLSMERNMQCAIGHCGHCQYGSQFICRDGPVFSYDKINHLLETKGY